MRLRAVRLRDVRRFGGAGVALEGLSGGLNVLSESNEAGKSTVFDAVRTALFFKDNSSHAMVRALQPWTGGEPVVELDMDFADTADGPLAGRSVRLRRTFHRSKGATELLDTATGSRIAISDTAHDLLLRQIGAKPGEGPTGLLWVEQGHSIAQPTTGPAETALLSELLSGEIGSVTGGERAERYLAEARRRMAEHRTPKTGKPKGEYRDLLEREAALDAELRELDARLEATERLRIDLSELERHAERAGGDVVEALRAELQAARARRIEAQRSEETLRHLRDRVDVSEREHAMAVAAHTAFEAAKAERADLSQRVERAKADLDALRARAVRAQGAVRDRDAAEADAHAARNAAQGLLDRAQASERSTAAQAELETLRGRVDEADALRREVDAVERELAAHSVDEADVRRLDALATEVRVARAAVEAAATRVRWTGEPGPRINGQAMGEAAMSLDGPTEIVFANGTLGVFPPDQSQGADALRAASAALRDALDASGVESVDAARDAHAEQREARERAVGLRARLAAVAPDGVEVLRERLESLEAELSAIDTDLPGPDDARQTRDAAEVVLSEARVAARAAQDARARAANALSLAERGVSELTERLNAGRKVLDGTDGEALAARVDAAEVKAEAARESLRQARGDQPSLDTAESDVRRLEGAVRNAEGAALTRVKRRAELSKALEIARADGLETLRAEVAGERERAVERRERVEASLRALDMLVAALASEREQARARYSAPILRALEPMVGHVIPEAQIRLGGGFTADGLYRNGRSEPVLQLSGGTQGQIAVLTRLAFADILQAQGRPTPVIFDETFVHSDDVRLEGLFRALHQACDRGVQAFVMTCHQRMYASLGGHSVRMESWN